MWGDLPYSDLQALVGVPNLIADMNSQDLAFTVHNGDLKAGSATVGSVTPTTCSDALYWQALAYFNALDAPAMFTPGDNDWTDCDRPANGGFLSLERLDRERAIFFSTPFSLGQRQLHQQVQESPLCLGVNGPVACVENRRWTVRRVTYATLNVQGSCNNLCDTNPDPAEWFARNQANIAWLQDTFAEATQRQSAAVLLIAQANPGWDLPIRPAPPSEIRGRWSRPTARKTGSATISWRCGKRSWSSGSRSHTFTAIRTTSGWTSLFSTPKVFVSRISRGSRPSATARQAATMTCSG